MNTLVSSIREWIQYYSNTSASYNFTTTAILACGDVHPNLGPALSSFRKQVGTKFNSLRALHLKARSVKATAESLDDRAKKTSKLTILQNLVSLEQYDIVWGGIFWKGTDIPCVWPTYHACIGSKGG
jgi:hypothetical protein